ncbi:hypothetical protein COO91_09783 (plasmid) [Nostoc flagelliforme CCNUN1]|uniref:Uncharacterized protein n=1 Tax=Nostoc flagelliforme CCNUN1 TaxID=2038116 RepID=A0A2K8T7F4_9NOSO|nr:hypothetical protein COO91_09783 [Nostoc flagelliforme CCNUN1]
MRLPWFFFPFPPKFDKYSYYSYQRIMKKAPQSTKFQQQ